MTQVYFIKKDEFKNQIAVFAALAILYGIGLWFFRGVDVTGRNFKLYYAESYLASARYEVSQMTHRGAATDVPTGSAQSVPVLLYHGLLSKSDGSNVTLKNFDDQMIALKKAGWHTITIDDMNEFLNGEKELPAKSLLITFDDGRKDSYYPANPILKTLGFNAVMFAIGQYSQESTSTYYLSTDEIKSMAKSNTWQIESHTMTHRDLTEIPTDELPSEIAGSKGAIEKVIGKPVIAFAFPFGEFGERAIDIVDQGPITDLTAQTYNISFYQYSTGERFSQSYSLGTTGHHTVKRISVRPSWTAADLMNELESGQAKPLPYTAGLNLYDGWVSTFWGKVDFRNDSLHLGSIASSTGSAAILDGSRLWKDYDVEADVKRLAGSNVYLWARYQNDSNYLACNFGNDLVHLEVTRNGVTTVIRGNEVSLPPDQLASGFTAGLRVQGRDAECLINGQVAVSTQFLDESLSSGGIGFKAWDRTLGTASMEVSSLNVTPL